MKKLLLYLMAILAFGVVPVDSFAAQNFFVAIEDADGNYGYAEADFKAIQDQNATLRGINLGTSKFLIGIYDDSEEKVQWYRLQRGTTLTEFFGAKIVANGDPVNYPPNADNMKTLGEKYGVTVANSVNGALYDISLNFNAKTVTVTADYSSYKYAYAVNGTTSDLARLEYSADCQFNIKTGSDGSFNFWFTNPDGSAKYAFGENGEGVNANITGDANTFYNLEQYDDGLYEFTGTNDAATKIYGLKPNASYRIYASYSDCILNITEIPVTLYIRGAAVPDNGWLTGSFDQPKFAFTAQPDPESEDLNALIYVGHWRISDSNYFCINDGDKIGDSQYEYQYSLQQSGNGDLKPDMLGDWLDLVKVNATNSSIHTAGIPTQEYLVKVRFPNNKPSANGGQIWIEKYPGFVEDTFYEGYSMVTHYGNGKEHFVNGFSSNDSENNLNAIYFDNATNHYLGIDRGEYDVIESANGTQTIAGYGLRLGYDNFCIETIDSNNNHAFWALETNGEIIPGNEYPFVNKASKAAALSTTKIAESSEGLQNSRYNIIWDFNTKTAKVELNTRWMEQPNQMYLYKISDEEIASGLDKTNMLNFVKSKIDDQNQSTDDNLIVLERTGDGIYEAYLADKNKEDLPAGTRFVIVTRSGLVMNVQNDNVEEGAEDNRYKFGDDWDEGKKSYRKVLTTSDMQAPAEVTTSRIADVDAVIRVRANYSDPANNISNAYLLTIEEQKDVYPIRFVFYPNSKFDEGITVERVGKTAQYELYPTSLLAKNTYMIRAIYDENDRTKDVLYRFKSGAAGDDAVEISKFPYTTELIAYNPANPSEEPEDPYYYIDSTKCVWFKNNHDSTTNPLKVVVTINGTEKYEAEKIKDKDYFRFLPSTPISNVTEVKIQRWDANDLDSGLNGKDGKTAWNTYPKSGTATWGDGNMFVMNDSFSDGSYSTYDNSSSTGNTTPYYIDASNCDGFFGGGDNLRIDIYDGKTNVQGQRIPGTDIVKFVPTQKLNGKSITIKRIGVGQGDNGSDKEWNYVNYTWPNNNDNSVQVNWNNGQLAVSGTGKYTDTSEQGLYVNTSNNLNGAAVRVTYVVDGNPLFTVEEAGVQPSGDVKVYFVDRAGWGDLHCYVYSDLGLVKSGDNWVGNLINAGFPGESMIRINDTNSAIYRELGLSDSKIGIWEYTLPADKLRVYPDGSYNMPKVIFANSSGAQTANLFLVKGGVYSNAGNGVKATSYLPDQEFNYWATNTNDQGISDYDGTPYNTIYLQDKELVRLVAEENKEIAVSIKYDRNGNGAKDYQALGIPGKHHMELHTLPTGEQILRLRLAEEIVPDGSSIKLDFWVGSAEDMNVNGSSNHDSSKANASCTIDGVTYHGSHFYCNNSNCSLNFTDVDYSDGNVYRRSLSDTGEEQNPVTTIKDLINPEAIYLVVLAGSTYENRFANSIGVGLEKVTETSEQVTGHTVYKLILPDNDEPAMMRYLIPNVSRSANNFYIRAKFPNNTYKDYVNKENQVLLPYSPSNLDVREGDKYYSITTQNTSNSTYELRVTWTDTEIVAIPTPVTASFRFVDVKSKSKNTVSDDAEITWKYNPGALLPTHKESCEDDHLVPLYFTYDQNYDKGMYYDGAPLQDNPFIKNVTVKYNRNASYNRYMGGANSVGGLVSHNGEKLERDYAVVGDYIHIVSPAGITGDGKIDALLVKDQDNKVIGARGLAYVLVLAHSACLGEIEIVQESTITVNNSTFRKTTLDIPVRFYPTPEGIGLLINDGELKAKEGTLEYNLQILNKEYKVIDKQHNKEVNFRDKLQFQVGEAELKNPSNQSERWLTLQWSDDTRDARAINNRPVLYRADAVTNTDPVPTFGQSVLVDNAHEPQFDNAGHALSDFNINNAPVIPIDSSIKDEEATTAKPFYLQINQNGIKSPVYTVNVTRTNKVDENGVPTGVEELPVDGEYVEGEEVEAIYYNLNGVKMNAERLEPGIYIKVTGTKSEKVYIR